MTLDLTADELSLLALALEHFTDGMHDVLRSLPNMPGLTTTQLAIEKIIADAEALLLRVNEAR